MVQTKSALAVRTGTVWVNRHAGMWNFPNGRYLGPDQESRKAAMTLIFAGPEKNRERLTGLTSCSYRALQALKLQRLLLSGGRSRLRQQPKRGYHESLCHRCFSLLVRVDFLAHLISAAGETVYDDLGSSVSGPS